MSLAEILKNCPKGMKLYSPIYGEVEFTEVSVITGSIGCRTHGCTVYFHSDGTYYNGGECNPKAFEENGGLNFEDVFRTASWRVETTQEGWLFSAVTRK